ncbi:hypothetical protein ACVWXF_002166 [Thermostichus sp. MS-CIW-40]|jgi:hypothetical protein
MKGGNPCYGKHRAVGHPVLKAQEMSLTGVTVRVSGTESLKLVLFRFSGAERFASA